MRIKVELMGDAVLKSSSNSKKGIINWIENNTHSSLIILVTILGFIYRLIASLSATGMVHPDEIYQSLEISHLITFGSGRKAAEFQTTNETYESYAASRSWTFPWIFAIFMKLGVFLGLDYHDGTLVMIRVFMAINATILIPAIAKLMYQLTKNRNISLYSAVFIAFWFRIVEYTVRTFNNTFFLPILFYGIYRVMLAIETRRITYWDHLIWFAGLGISTYNRLDLMIFIVGFFILTFSLNSWKVYGEVFLDSLFGWIFCYAVDYNYYRNRTPVPLNWYRFNIRDGHSDIFGLNSWDYYINEVIIYDGLLNWARLTILVLFFTVLIRFKYIDFQLKDENRKLIDIFHKFSAFTIVSWMIYSSLWRDITFSKLITFITFGGGWNPQSHKEIRFIIGGLVILMCLFAIMVEVLLQLIIEFMNKLYKKRSENQNLKIDFIEIRYWFKVIAGGIIILLLITQSFQSSPIRYHLESYDDTNEAMEWVGRQKDLQAVMIGLVWFLTGGYTYLHVDNDVEIVNVDFATDEQSVKNYYINQFRAFISNHRGGEYFILPSYQISYFPNVINEMIDSDWYPVQVIDGRTQIWKYG